ncbi:3-hydroxyacyl-ACP dehydratase FabZ family protein [Geothrix paludis]|uniref:3-hydroxyacyl-ACP dehydratase FabZ family protein n=1 Tax=Geothrix paludis TaxID=2922722 RepID=UPI001FAC4789|nr:3-hydroxyacyl-ACP dehydratase FabZ family protein [Geothrix paludis]
MDILAHLPHRAPLLLVDRLLEREPGLRVVAEKLITASEPYLQDHPDGRAQVPGPLLLEMLAQAGGFLEAGTLHGASIFLAGVRDARFLAPALPGDRLRLEVAAEGAFAGLMRLQGTASCEGRDLCTATLLVKRL